MISFSTFDNRATSTWMRVGTRMGNGSSDTRALGDFRVYHLLLLAGLNRCRYQREGLGSWYRG